VNLRYGECGLNYFDLGANETASSITTGPDGKVVITGTKSGGSSPQSMFVARLTSEGALDDSFAGGVVVTDLGGKVDRADEAAVQPDGKTLVLAGDDADSKLIRLNQDGSLDVNFADHGIFALSGHAEALGLQPGGRIVILTDLGVVRLSAYGEPDDTLSSDAAGQAGTAMAVDDAGRMIVGVVSANTVREVAFTSDGVVDSTFGAAGVTARDLAAEPSDLSVALLSDGSSVLTTSLVGAGTQVMRFTPAGVPDDTFGTAGVLSIGRSSVGATSVDAADRIVLGGGPGGTADPPWIGRFSPEGVADSGFGADGFSELPSSGHLAGTTIVSDDRPVGVGQVHNTTDDFYVVGLQNDATRAPQGLEVDGWGGVHPFTTCGGQPASVSGGPYWPGWTIVRGIAASSSVGGLVLDGWGGLHPVTVNGKRPKSVNGGPYWDGWDITRGVAILPDGTGGYVLDAWGGLHPFGINGHERPPITHGEPYWKGWDIARGVTLLPDGTGGYVLDAFGGLHPFNTTGVAAPPTSGAPYWNGWDIARGVALSPGGTGGYIVDGYGGLHTFRVGADAPPRPAGGPYWSGWDINRGVTVF
jgi:uncharacterized delta-60 repeat protein